MRERRSRITLRSIRATSPRIYEASAKNFSSVNGSGVFAGSRGSTPAKRDASKCQARRGGRPQARLRVYDASQRTGSFSMSIIW